jgi:hypothetical protein
MVNVTQRVRQVKQPYGGYINPKVMEVRYLGREGTAAMIDHTAENVHSSLVGLAVDYLTRTASGKPAAQVFFNALSGARLLGDEWHAFALALCEVVDDSRSREFALPGTAASVFMVPNFKNPEWAAAREAYMVPDSDAIKAAIKLSSFDVLAHAGLAAYNPDASTDPDDTTIQHVASMVASSLRFVWEYGPVIVDGFTMLGGYTETVDRGDGDFVTVDTLWDFKVSVKPPTSAHTLQVLIYWLMARRSNWNWNATWNWNRTMSEAEWRDVWDLDAYVRENRAWPDNLNGPAPTHIGIYNPRLDAVYRIAVASIPPEVIAEVSHDVIGYE